METSKFVSLIAFIIIFNDHICFFSGNVSSIRARTVISPLHSCIPRHTLRVMSQYMKGSEWSKCSPMSFHINQVKARCLIWANVNDFPEYSVFTWQKAMVAKVFAHHTLSFPIFLVTNSSLLWESSPYRHRISTFLDGRSSNYCGYIMNPEMDV